MHAVQATDKRRLAATLGPYESGRMVGRDMQVDILQRVVGPVPCVQILN